MQKGIYKYRTDTRRYKRELHKEEAKLLDALSYQICIILKVSNHMQDALDTELSKEEEALLRKHLPKKRTVC